LAPPQRGHTGPAAGALARRVPHCSQNTLPAWFTWPQWGQVMQREVELAPPSPVKNAREV